MFKHIRIRVHVVLYDVLSIDAINKCPISGLK
jgi:hypothetical protein